MWLDCGILSACKDIFVVQHGYVIHLSIPKSKTFIQEQEFCLFAIPSKEIPLTVFAILGVFQDTPAIRIYAGKLLHALLARPYAGHLFV
jgi:hypothetical protein